MQSLTTDQPTGDTSILSVDIPESVTLDYETDADGYAYAKVSTLFIHETIKDLRSRDVAFAWEGSIVKIHQSEFPKLSAGFDDHRIVAVLDPYGIKLRSQVIVG